MTDLSEATKNLSEIAELMKDLTPRQSRLLKATMFGPTQDICGITVPPGVADYVRALDDDKLWDFHRTFKMDATRAVNRIEKMPDYEAKHWDTTTLAWIDV